MFMGNFTSDLSKVMFVSYHCSVWQGGGTEDTASGRIGDVGEHIKRLSGLWKASSNCHIIKIPGADIDGGGWILDIGGREPSKGNEDVGMDYEDTGTEGEQPTGIGDIF